MGLERLRKKFNVESFAVISEESMKPLCKKYYVDFCFHENLPLGRKKNFGLSQSLQKSYDFLVEIGSDDILKDEFMEVYPFDRDVSGLCDFAMVNTENGDCRRLNDRNAKYGLGRTISRQVVEQVTLWTDTINIGLDNNSSLMLAKNGYLEKRYKAEEPVAIDLKSETNLWPFNYSMGIDYPMEKVLKGLSKSEQDAICFRLKNR